ncbi:hypothetical protein DB44_DE00100 [Candidatus Protochlamydia amoebophila]|uniref:Uncharacterized protein n=1 Tax=Candidatus Protochlamydia amoebophila TaxID=362787 RepID=A0A0C1H1W4_9BACT|nr:hypothetical protein DB44_DE00100 [Candidatus Protochlamydia amoebophila]
MNVYVSTGTVINNQFNYRVDMIYSKLRTHTNIITSSLSNTLKKIELFIRNNLHNILFLSASCATAYFSPSLFIMGAVLAIVLRFEVRYLFNEYIKEEHNPYLDGIKFGPNYVNNTSLLIATVAAIDSIALGTFFTTNYIGVSLFPFAGGLAAGNILAQRGIDLLV